MVMVCGDKPPRSRFGLMLYGLGLSPALVGSVAGHIV